MFYIKVKSEFLELPSDFKVDLILENPLFLQDRIPAPYTTSFDLPMTYNVKKLLNNADRVNIINRSWEFDASVLGYGARPLFYGIVLVREIGGRFSTNFQASDDLSAIRKNMNDIDWGTIQYGVGGYAMRTNPQWAVGLPGFNVDLPMAVYKDHWEDARDDELDYTAAPIKNNVNEFPTGFEGSTLLYLNALYGQNQFFNPWGNLSGNIIPIDHEQTRYGHSPIYPQMRVAFFLKKLLNIADERNPFSEGELKKMVMTSHYHKNFRDDLIQKWAGIILDNPYPGVSDPDEMLFVKLQSHQPAFPASEALKSILNVVCATLYRVQAGPQLVNVVKLNRDLIEDPTFQNWDAYLGTKLVLSREESQGYAYGYDDFNEGEVPVDPEFQLSTVADIIAAPVNAETREQVYFIQTTGQLILKKLAPKVNSGDPDNYFYEVKHNGLSRSTVDGGYRISSTLGPLKMAPVVGIDYFSNTQAKPNTLVYMPAYEGSRNDQYKPHLMLYWGNITNGLNPPFFVPYLSYHNYTADGIRLGDLSMQWDGPDGLIENYHKRFKEWIESNRLLAKGEFIFSPNMIKDIDLSQKVLVRGKLWWIKKLTIPLTKKKIEPVQAELIEAPLPTVEMEGSSSGSGSGGGGIPTEPTGTCYTIEVSKNVFDVENDSFDVQFRRPGEALTTLSYFNFPQYFDEALIIYIYFCSDIQPILIYNEEPVDTDSIPGVFIFSGGSCLIDGECIP